MDKFRSMLSSNEWGLRLSSNSARVWPRVACGVSQYVNKKQEGLFPHLHASDFLITALKVLTQRSAKLLLEEW